MDKQLAPEKVTIRWIEDGDTAGDLDILAARLRLNRTDLLRLITRLVLYPDVIADTTERLTAIQDQGPLST